MASRGPETGSSIAALPSNDSSSLNCIVSSLKSIGALKQLPLKAMRPLPAYSSSWSLCFFREPPPSPRRCVFISKRVWPVQKGDATVFSIHVNPILYTHWST